MSFVTGELQDVLSRTKARRAGKGYIGRCPCHDDKTASLSISAGEKQAVVVNCQAGCDFKDVRNALGLKRPTATASRSTEPLKYDYTDADGKLLYQVLRWPPKEFKQQRPDGQGGWLRDLDGVPRVPYCLPDLIEAIALGKRVFVPEGEKDCESLRSVGLVATTNSGGAAWKWTPDFAENFRSARVVVLPDNDNPGRAHALQVSAALCGIAESVKVLPLPGLPEKGDVTDWLLGGGKPLDLERMAEDAETVAPTPVLTVESALMTRVERPTKRPITLRRLLEGPVPPPPSLTVERFLLAADINFLGGDGDAGKSTSMFSLAVVVPIARPFLGTLAVRLPGPVVLLVPEDGATVARHHSESLIAGLEGVTDEERATLARDIHIVGDDRPINLLNDTAELYEKIAPLKPALVIAEPMASLIGGESENDESVAEAVCSNLRRDIARPLGAAVLMAGHLRKPSREGPVTAATVHDLKGSSGWANHSRIVWMVSKPKGGTQITYRLVKSNRLKTGIEHQATLAISADPDNEAHWITCRLTDANLGANSDSLTPGRGRRLNDNEIAVLSALDDHHAPDSRLSWSRWHKLSGITSENTFKSIRSRVLDAGLADARTNGRRTRNGSPEYDYGITPSGRQSLATGWAVDTPKGEGVRR